MRKQHSPSKYPFPNNQLNASIQNAATFLNLQQKQNGSFWSTTKTADSQTKPTSSIFISALIGCTLSDIRLPALASCISQLKTWLESQKSLHSTFNYWERRSWHDTHYPYPDDADTTYCALHFLDSQSKRPSIFTATNLLTALEEAPGGPYNTWFVSCTQRQEAWNLPDIPVEIHMARYFATYGICLHKLNKRIAAALSNDTLQGRFYCTHWPALYALTGWWKDSQTLQRKFMELDAKSPFETVYKIACKTRLGIHTTNDIASLIALQEANGSWPSAPLFFEQIDTSTINASVESKELSTALALSTLVTYQRSLNQSLSQKKREKFSHVTDFLPLIHSIFPLQDPSQARILQATHQLIFENYTLQNLALDRKGNPETSKISGISRKIGHNLAHIFTKNSAHDAVEHILNIQEASQGNTAIRQSLSRFWSKDTRLQQCRLVVFY